MHLLVPFCLQFQEIAQVPVSLKRILRWVAVYKCVGAYRHVYSYWRFTFLSDLLGAMIVSSMNCILRGKSAYLARECQANNSPFSLKREMIFSFSHPYMNSANLKPELAEA